MAFSRKIKEDILVDTARHCCVCHRYKGIKIEVHHIVPKKYGGKGTFENAIALCFDCHCDAGHYVDGHPKGSKFSPSELRKQKENWIQNVKENRISPKKKSPVHTKYLITKNTSLIKEIIHKDLSNFPVNNSLILETPPLHFIRPFLGRKKFRDEGIHNNPGIKEKDYLKKFPDAKCFEEGLDEFIFFHHLRIPSVAEIRKVCKNDEISNYLIDKDIDPEKITKVITCHTGACEGKERFEEIFMLRPLFVKFLVLTNTSSSPIKLKKFETLVLNETLAKRKHFNEIQEVPLPNVFIESRQTVIIPLGSFLSDYGEIQKDLNFSTIQSIPGHYHQYYEHGAVKKSKEFDYFGLNYLPQKIYIEEELETISYELHPFDFSNVYWVNRSLGYGSCPHLFYYKRQGQIKYQGEIFDVPAGQTCLENIKIEKDVDWLIIAELEQEETHIEYIQIDNRVIFDSVVLQNDEFLKIPVKKGSKLKNELPRRKHRGIKIISVGRNVFSRTFGLDLGHIF